MKLCVFALINIVFVGSALGALSIYWRSTSTGLPIAADVEAIAINPVAPSMLYVGTFGQGVYRSIDNGSTWVTATTSITCVQNALAVDPFSTTVVYAGEYYGGGVYRSMDSGLNWTSTLTNAFVRSIASSPISPGLVLAGDRLNGIYRSVDFGGTWVLISVTAGLTDTQVNAIAFGLTAPYTAYLGTAQLIFVSGDGGSTWQYRSDLPSAIFAFASTSLTPTKLFASTFNDGVYTSTDDGLTWMPANSGLPANEWITSLAIDPYTPTIVYAGAWSGQVYRSEDSGASWAGLGYLGSVYAIAVHPAARNVIYAGTSNNRLFRGSALDHITIDPVSTTQYVYRPFTLTITVRDALGFPLSGAVSAQVQDLVRQDARLAATLSNGYNGTAVLTDTAHLITPTNVNLINGVGAQPLVFKQPLVTDTITATLQSEGLQTVSDAFEVRWFAQTYLPLIYRP